MTNIIQQVDNSETELNTTAVHSSQELPLKRTDPLTPKDLIYLRISVVLGIFTSLLSLAHGGVIGLVGAVIDVSIAIAANSAILWLVLDYVFDKKHTYLFWVIRFSPYAIVINLLSIIIK